MKSLVPQFLLCTILLSSLCINAQVGVGTTSPNAALDIVASNQATPANTDGILIPRVDEFPVTNPTIAQDGMLVYATGNGSVAQGFYFWNQSGTTWQSFLGTSDDWSRVGNAGTVNGTNFIGTTDAQNLDVRTNNVIRHRFTQQGQLEFLNNGSSVFLGQGAGANDDLVNNQNTFVGFNAGQDNTSGRFNSFYGQQSGINTTSGLRNSFYGRTSGFSNTSGDNNTGLGVDALRENQTGVNNVAIGRDAGRGTTGQSKSGGVFIGYQAGMNEDNNARLYIDNSNTSTPLVWGDFSTNTLRANGTLQVGDPSGTGYQFPTTDGSMNQLLQTDGNGNLSFTTFTGSGWLTTGNSGTNAGSNFVGTIDNQNLSFRTNNTLRMRLTTRGQLEFLNTGNSVFIGQDAGDNDDLSSNSNTFVGTQAGTDNTTGGNNNFFGANAGAGNTTGNQNNFFGVSAGLSNTTGRQNSFFGQTAGFTNTTGFQNCFFGLQSGNQSTTGNNNAAFGVSSGENIGSGNFNAYFGANAGRDNEQSNNVAIGAFALNTNVNGSGNVAIGFSAGFSETGSDRLYIDNSNTSTPLIWGDFANDRVGISRQATTNALEVNGNASKSAAGDWLANSDARLKKDITPLDAEATLQRLLALQGITYEWDDTFTGNSRPTGKHYGFTAQNIQEIFPTLVKEDAQGYLQTAYGTYDAMQVEAVRALYERILNLEKENNTLRADNESLRAQNTSANSRITAIEQWIAQQGKSSEPTIVIENDLGEK